MININSYNTLFITEDTLKEWSLVNENMDMKLLTPGIRATQELDLIKCLGGSLYSDLQDKIKAQTLNQDELFLMVAYIQPVMIWGIMKRIGYYSTYRYSNKGVQQSNSDNSQPVDKTILSILSDDAQNNFNQYVDKLIRHLRANRTLFPAYCIVANQDDVFPLQEAWTSGISLDAPIRSTINGDVIARRYY